MLPGALEYPLGDGNGFRVYRPGRGGGSCEHFGGYKTINRIPLPLLLVSYRYEVGDALHALRSFDMRIGR